MKTVFDSPTGEMQIHSLAHTLPQADRGQKISDVRENNSSTSYRVPGILYCYLLLYCYSLY